MQPTSSVPVTQGSLLGSFEVGGACLTETRHSGGTGLPCHSHARPAITLVLGGAFSETFGRTTHACGPLSLLFKPAGAEHTNRFAAGGARSFIVELLPDLTGAAEPFVSFERIAPQRGVATLAPLALKLYGLFRRGQLAAATECEELALRLVGAGEARLGAVRAGAPAWIRAIEEQLRAECAALWSLSALARRAGVHPVYLARVFRRYYGVSIGEHIRRCGVASALVRLADPRTRATAVAHEAGYCDQSHFGRAFRRETGASPSAYRRDVLAADVELPAAAPPRLGRNVLLDSGARFRSF